MKCLIGTIPNLLGDRAAVVQIHAHALFLRALTSEDIGRDWLLDLCLTKQDLVFGLLDCCFDLDDLASQQPYPRAEA